MKVIALFISIALNVVALRIDSVLAGEVGDLVDFEKGTPAVADQVDKNFNDIKTEVNDNDDRITTNASKITTNTSGIVTNATGIANNATNISNNTTAIAGKQNRVTGTCPAGQSIRIIKENGTVTCQPDTNSGGDITGVYSGNFLSGGKNKGEVTLHVVGMPGVDYAETNTNQYMTQTDRVMLSRTLTAPTSGYVVATFNAVGVLNHTVNTYQYMRCWINTNGGSSSSGNSFRYFQVANGAPTGPYYDAASTMVVLPVSSGSTTFYAVGDGNEPSGSTKTYFYKCSLNLMFFPARY
jgi:hypothetical protein